MRAHSSYLAALAVLALAAATGLSTPAGAQPFGRGLAMRVAERGHERREERREERGEGRREGGREYRAPPAYSQAPPPRAYAYPAPAPAYPYAQRGAPPAYQAAPPPNYAPPPAQAPYAYASPEGPGRNSLGAYWGQQQDAARRGVREGRLMELGQVTAGIRRSTPGRMLDAGLEPGPDGRPAYRVRWAAAGGRRIDFIVDAATGAIIGQNGY